MMAAWTRAVRASGGRTGSGKAALALAGLLCFALLRASPVAFAGDTPELQRAAERIIRSLEPIHGNIRVARSDTCSFRIDREFSGELATHQQVSLNLAAVTYADRGATLGPKRNDETYRDIAKHRPYAVFFGSRSGKTVAHTETWFDPNPFRLARSFVDETIFELYAESIAERDALAEAVMALAAACRDTH